ncbi:MAG: LuxR C-terminal-related transcriptional regulator [Mangrovibacterium sp.]
MNNSLTEIIIADSQFLVVEALKSLLSKEERFLVTGVAGTQYELYKMLRDIPCSLIITDLTTFDYDAVDDLKKIRETFPHANILLLANSVNKAEFYELARIGIKNIIFKTADRDEILTAIDSAIKGRKYYSEEILNMILETNEKKLIPEEPTHLTGSEIEIVRLIADGLTTKEIALQKNISFHTVNTHRKNIFRKMQVSNASELIMHAIKAGWIDNIEYYI